MFKKLRNALPNRAATLETNLSGVNGYTGRGTLEFTAWRNGARSINVVLRGVAGRDAEIQVGENALFSVSVDKGRVAQKFSSRKGHDVPDLSQGSEVRISQNGVIILEGVLVPD